MIANKQVCFWCEELLAQGLMLYDSATCVIEIQLFVGVDAFTRQPRLVILQLLFLEGSST
jgi:hypothetical protein